jgi:hypothetical protein
MTDPAKKADLRAEIARLREELAAEKARSEVLAGHAHCHGCTCAHATWFYPYVTNPAVTWTTPYVTTCSSNAGAAPVSHEATGVGISTSYNTLS